MRILALSGSPATPSINAALLAHATSLLPEGTEVDRVSVLDIEQPFWTSTAEAAGVPAAIQSLHARLQAADGVVLASPEHNGGAPALLKNTLDWLSRVNPGQPWLPRPLLLLSASPGARGGAGNLSGMAGLAPWWGATVVGHMSVGSWHSAADPATGALLDPTLAATLRDHVAALAAAARG